MSKHKKIDQSLNRVEALQLEAARLAEQATNQLTDYARTFDISKQTKQAQSAVQDGREQLQHAAAQASDQVGVAMATALEEAAGRLRTYKGDGPTAQVARNAAGALEQGSEYLQPWGTRSMFRRMIRTIRNHPLPVMLFAIGAFGVAYFRNRSKPVVI